MTAPADYSNLYSKTRRPRSPQGDGAYDANGMAPPTGQQHAYGQNDGGAYNSQTSHPRPPQQQGQGFQANTQPGPGNQGGAQTFSQMQAQGQARPLPPMQQTGPSSQTPTYQPSQQQNQLGNQLQQAVSQTLQTPTRYDLPQVQQVRDALTNQLQTQYTAQQKQINDQLASRGLLSSSIAGGYYGDLATNQANALADMNAKLIQDAAATNAADRSSSLASAQNLSNSQSAQGIAGYNANLAGQNQAQQFGLQQGGLTGTYNGQQTLAGQAQAQQNAVQVGGLTGQYVAPGSAGAGQNTLGAQQLSQSGQQFAQNLALQSQLGQGNLGVAQQQANTGAAAQQAQAQQAQQQMNIQNQQFGQTYVLQQAAQNLNAQVQTGQLSLAQAQQQLAQLQNTQQYGLAQGQLGISQQQANTTQAAQQSQAALANATLLQNAAQFGQTYALQQAQQELQNKVQTGQLTLAQAQQQFAEQQATVQNALQAGQLTGSYGGQQTLAAQQLATQQGQFQQTFAQNAAQFGQTYALQQAQQDLAKQVQLGQLSNQTAQQKLAELAQQTQVSQFGQTLAAQQTQNAAQNALQTGQLTGTYNGQQTLGAQQLAQQGSQNTLQNQLAFMQLLNSPTGTLAATSNATFAPDFITQLYKALGIDTSKLSTTNKNSNQTTTDIPGAGTGSGGSSGVGGTGDVTDNTGTLIFGRGRGMGANAVAAPNLAQQAYSTMIPAFDQTPIGSRQLTPEMLAEMQKTQQPVNPESSQSTTGSLQPVGPAQPQAPDVTEQMGLTPAQLAQLQRMLGLSNG